MQTNIKSRQIHTYHVGECGVKLGLTLWELFCAEHNLNLQGFDNDKKISNDLKGNQKFSNIERNQLFYELPNGRWIPKALLIDTDIDVFDVMKRSKYSQLFIDDNIAHWKHDSHNNFGIGFGEYGLAILPEVINKLRLLYEKTDKLNGFIMFNALGGGAGSGFSTRILLSLEDEIQTNKIIRSAQQVFPSSTSTSIVEPLNAALALSKQKNLLNFITCYDNTALRGIINHLDHKTDDIHYSMNQIISRNISNILRTTRCSLRTIQELMIPFPALKYLVCSTQPVQKFSPLCEKELAINYSSHVFNSLSCMISNIDDGRFIKGVLMYRGFKNLEMFKQTKVKKQFYDWGKLSGLLRFQNIRPMVKVDKNWVYNCQKFSLSLLHNNTAIVNSFKKIESDCRIMIKTQSFLHQYENAGISKDEFFDSFDALKSIKECYTYQNIINHDKFNPCCEQFTPDFPI